MPTLRLDIRAKPTIDVQKEFLEAVAPNHCLHIGSIYRGRGQPCCVSDVWRSSRCYVHIYIAAHVLTWFDQDVVPGTNLTVELSILKLYKVLQGFDCDVKALRTHSGYAMNCYLLGKTSDITWSFSCFILSHVH